MAMHEIKEILLWGVGMNYLIVGIWFGLFALAHDRLYQFHRHWFRLSVETFDAIHYTGMAIYKMGIMLFNLVPLIALYLTS